MTRGDLLDTLERIQWGARDEFNEPVCPVCEAEDGYHSAGCTLDTAIKELRSAGNLDIEIGQV